MGGWVGEHISNSGPKTLCGFFDVGLERGLSSGVLELKWWGVVACSIFPIVWDKPVCRKRKWSPHTDIGIGKMADERVTEIITLFPFWAQLCLRSPPSLYLWVCKSVTPVILLKLVWVLSLSIPRMPLNAEGYKEISWIQPQQGYLKVWGQQLKVEDGRSPSLCHVTVSWSKIKIPGVENPFGPAWAWCLPLVW